MGNQISAMQIDAVIARKKGVFPLTKMIEVNGVSMSFGTIKAITNISFYVEQGALFIFRYEWR
jgi:hypothetical protein